MSHVIYIGNLPWQKLTLGKIYEVDYYFKISGQYKLMDDEGHSCIMHESYFKDALGVIRNNKINSILDEIM